MTILVDLPVPTPTSTSTPRNVLREMNRTGDTTIEWTPGAVAEVGAARAHFDKLKRSGYLAYRTDDAGRGAQLHAFDETAGEIIMTPALVGG